MKYDGTITEVRRSRAGVTLIIDTTMGLRGVEFERDLLDEILHDFELTQDTDLIGWAVVYDPAHGDLDIIMPDDFDGAPDSDQAAGTDDGPARE
jgi:hypothetical protein